MPKGTWNKIEWSEDNIEFIKSNFHTKTNKELAKCLGLKLSSVRKKCYELGLYKMTLEYWTDEQVQFLKENYKKFGDNDLAKIFNEKWFKQKGWTKKHIEKKRKYLNLKRTDEQLLQIHQNLVKNGWGKLCNKKRWETTGSNKLGTIVIWDQKKYIKISSGYIPLRIFNYTVFNGPVPKGMMVIHIDKNNLNCNPENLLLLSKADNARRNRWNSYGKYPEDVKIQLRKISKLKQIIKKKSNEQIDI